MTDEIRKIVKKKIQERGITNRELGAALGYMQQPNITRMLNGRSGNVPKKWQELLVFLNLELTVKEKES